MEFLYNAYNKAGKPVRGIIDAASPVTAAATLRGQGLLILSVKEKRNRSPRFSFASILSSTRFLRVSSTERVLLARHLALILRPGIPIDRALDILQEHRKNRALKTALQDIVALIRKGETLSEGFSRYPAVFPSVAVAVIRWGEAGGSLVESLDHLATQMEKDHDLRVKVRGAFIYPLIVIGATVIVGIIMGVFILPRIVGLIESF
jgi:type IV pilus assembly protein PilC